MIKLHHLLATLLAGLTLLLNPAQAAVTEIDRIVALVNDEVITASELRTQVTQVARQLQQRNTQLPPEDVLVQQVLERQIMIRLQLQLAERTGVRVDDETLNATVQNIARQNGLSLSQFRDALVRDGYDFAAFRDEVRTEILLNRLRQRQVENRIVITEQEIDNYLATVANQAGANQEYELGHILIAVPEAATPDAIAKARSKAERVLAELRGGADFAQTAVAYSDGQQALQGGELGWRKAGQLPSLFAELVVNMQPGDTSDLIRSPSGFHIIKVKAKRGGESYVITQTKARHILIRTNQLVTDQQAQTRLEQLRQRIVGGDDFASLARSHSDDTGSAAEGGGLGWVSPGDTVPEFEKEMNALGIGEVSQPFRSRFGWHIVQVEQRRNYDDTEEYKRSKAREAIFKRKLDEETTDWLRRLRDEAYVEYRLDKEA